MRAVYCWRVRTGRPATQSARSIDRNARLIHAQNFSTGLRSGDSGGMCHDVHAILGRREPRSTNKMFKGENTARRPSASSGVWILNIAVKKVSLHFQESPVLVYAPPHFNKQQARRTPCAPLGRPCADPRAGAPTQKDERKRLASSPPTASSTSGLQSTEPSSHRGRCALHWPLGGRRRAPDARAEPGECCAR